MLGRRVSVYNYPQDDWGNHTSGYLSVIVCLQDDSVPVVEDTRVVCLHQLPRSTT